MNKQSQWLFEAPPLQSTRHRMIPSHHLRRQALYGAGMAPASICPPFGQTLPWIIMGWSQYRQRVEELPQSQQDVVRAIGDAIISSFRPKCSPVREVRIQGHADYDTPRNLDREQRMSKGRAQQVTNWLKNYVTSMVGAEKANQIVWVPPVGFGAARLKAPPTKESNRSQNRRVEVFVTVSSPPPPDRECLCIDKASSFVRLEGQIVGVDVKNGRPVDIELAVFNGKLIPLLSW